MKIDVEAYLDCRDAMPTCADCGAGMSGNITCRSCRETYRAEYKKHGWPTEWLDRMDEINPPLVKPLGIEEVKGFIERVGMTGNEVSDWSVREVVASAFWSDGTRQTRVVDIGSAMTVNIKSDRTYIHWETGGRPYYVEIPKGGRFEFDFLKGKVK